MKRAICTMAAYFLACGSASSGLDDIFSTVHPSLRLDHTVGLDDTTRRLIDGYPEKIRIELIKALKEALPLIDASVQNYLQTVDRIMAGQLRLGACLMIGSGKTIVEELGNQVPGRGARRPIRDLRAYRDQLLKGLERDSTPFEYAEVYGDIMLRAGATACQAEAVAAPAILPLSTEIHTEALMRFNLWYGMRGVCSNAQACLRYIENQVATQIQRADQRDSSQVGAAARFERLVLPDDGFFDRFDRDSYERPMLELVSMRRDLLVAKLVRETKSQMLLDSANSELSKMSEVVAVARRALYHPGARYNGGQIRNAREGNAKAKTLLTPVPPNLARADAMVKSAVEGNSGLSASASGWQSRAEKLLADVRAVNKTADEYLAVASQLAAREEFFDRNDWRRPR